MNTFTRRDEIRKYRIHRAGHDRNNIHKRKTHAAVQKHFYLPEVSKWETKRSNDGVCGEVLNQRRG